ncbi:uncharacterized protein LOC133138930 [Conger conger]|uniref:uncharacterized protein LOC133138930 n=1 Tax=Conger conger TaxID=82655 RepID=UPI002A5AD717|nr:uncharacterized protein LOC133138930 [Conger conger]
MATASPTEGVEPCGRQQLAVGGFEIYVPREADVRSVLAQDLPSGILKRMGLLSPGRLDMDSATVTWISPVVVHEKAPCLPPGPHGAPPPGPHGAPPPGPHGAPPPSRCGPAAREFLTSAAESCGSAPGAQGQFLLPVACSNLAAFRVLREFMPHRDSQPAEPKWESSQPACARRGQALCFSQDAIIIHQGHIFLSIKKAEPGAWRGEPGQRSMPEVAPPQLTAVCGSRRPEDAQHGSVPTAAPEQVQQRAAGLRALCQQFGVKRRACIALVDLPNAALKTLSAVGCVDLEKHPTAAQLCRKAERSRLGSFGRGCLAESRNGGAEDLPGARCSEDGRKGVAYYRDNVTEEEESKEPVSKKARLVSGGDASTGGVEGGDLATGEAKAGDLDRAEVQSEGLGRAEIQSEDLGRAKVKGEDLGRAEVQSEDLGKAKVKGEDLDRAEVQSEALGRAEVQSEDLGKAKVKGEDLGRAEVKSEDLSTGDDEDEDRSTGESDDLGAGESDDLGAGGVWAGEGREQNGGGGAQSAGEDPSGGECRVEDEACLHVPGLEYTAGFDFEQSARDERISRIRARLSEKEAALRRLARLPL